MVMGDTRCCEIGRWPFPQISDFGRSSAPSFGDAFSVKFPYKRHSAARSTANALILLARGSG